MSLEKILELSINIKIIVRNGSLALFVSWTLWIALNYVLHIHMYDMYVCMLCIVLYIVYKLICKKNNNSIR